MLAVRRERADRRGPQRVAGVAAARAGRGAVVDLVDDQDVVAARDLADAAAAPRAAAASRGRPSASRSRRSAAGSARTGSRRRRASGEAGRAARDRRSGTRGRTSRASRRATAAAATAGQTTSAVRARWRRSSSCTTRPGLDRLAEADVVGDQQRRARHPQRADERLELVVLDRDAAAERRLQRALVGARDRAPADGVEERVELRRDRRARSAAIAGSSARSTTVVPGSISQTTSSSSPVASSSTETSETRCCTGRPSSDACESRTTSPTTHIRPRTQASWPDSGGAAGASASVTRGSARSLVICG